MRELINLVEAFNTDVSLTKHVEDDGKYGIFVFYDFVLDGRSYSVGFKGHEGEYVVSFTGEKAGIQTGSLTGDNIPMRVFGAVSKAIHKFIEEYDPDQIEFMIAGNELKRVGTYDKIFEFLERNDSLPAGYVWDRDGNYNYYIFKDGHR